MYACQYIQRGVNAWIGHELEEDNFVWFWAFNTTFMSLEFFLLPPWPSPPVVFVEYIIPVSKGGGGERGGVALVVEDWRWMGLLCMWGGKESVLVFCFVSAYKPLLYMCLTPSCSLENPTGPNWTNDLYWQGRTEAGGERPVLLPLCPLQISHGLVWVWTWAFVLKG